MSDVRRRHRGEDALELVGAAGDLSALVEACGQHLLGEFVDGARRDGASWAQIGAALGVTRQAVQQRFAPRTPAGVDAAIEGSVLAYTQRARRALDDARELAIEHKHAAIGTAHVLVTAFESRSARSGKVVAELGARRADLRTRARAELGADGRRKVADPPLATPARKALDVAEREALRLGVQAVGTEHLLLGLAADPTTAAGEVLAVAGIDTDRARTAARRVRSASRSDAR